MRTTAVAVLFSLISSGLIAACSGGSSTGSNNAKLQTVAVVRRAPPAQASASATLALGSVVTGGRLPARHVPTCHLPMERPDGPSTSAPWRLEVADITTHPAAVCNDGSPAVFMIRHNPTTTRWLVWLEGGGNCAEGTTCNQRWNESKGLMSSQPIRDRYAAGRLEFPASGVFSNDPNENPAFHDASMVRVQYCSSDLWSGDRTGNPALPANHVARWHFQGRAIALAAIDALVANEGFGNATEITFAGGSAGSMGLQYTVDELRGRSPANARVIGISDGGFQIAYPPYDPLTQTESTVTPTPIERAVLLWQQNWGGRGDATCHAAAANDIERANCRLPELLTRDRHIATPMLIVNNQYDYNQTQRHGIDLDIETGTVPDQPQQAYIRRFATRMREQLAHADLNHAIFSSYDKLHVTSQSNDALVKTINGKLQRDAIADWHRDPCSPARDIEVEIPGRPPIAGSL